MSSRIIRISFPCPRGFRRANRIFVRQSNAIQKVLQKKGFSFVRVLVVLQNRDFMPDEPPTFPDDFDRAKTVCGNRRGSVGVFATLRSIPIRRSSQREDATAQTRNENVRNVAFHRTNRPGCRVWSGFAKTQAYRRTRPCRRRQDRGTQLLNLRASTTSSRRWSLPSGATPLQSFSGCQGTGLVTAHYLRKSSDDL